MAGILFIISAPSGSGKSTLVSELRKQVSGVDFCRLVDHARLRAAQRKMGANTTSPRATEFERMVEEGMFLEHAEVFGHCLRNGPAVAGRCAQGRATTCFSTSTCRARRRCARSMPEAVSIFVLPPNPKVLRTRLRNRSRAEGAVNEAELYRRLSEASKEIENYREYGYILVNDILDRAVAQLEAIVLAERFYRNGEADRVSFAPSVGGCRGLPASPTRRSGSNLCWRRLESSATPRPAATELWRGSDDD